MNKYLDKYIGLFFIFLSIIFSLILFQDKRNKYIHKYYEMQNNISKIKMCENSLKELEDEKKQLEKNLLNLNDQKKVVIEKLNEYAINDNEFKKIIYSFVKKSNLKLEEITEKKAVDNLLGYKLNYVNVCTNGDLVSLGKLLYYLNKIPYHVDTKYFTLSVKGTKQILNLGYVEYGDSHE